MGRRPSGHRFHQLSGFLAGFNPVMVKRPTPQPTNRASAWWVCFFLPLFQGGKLTFSIVHTRPSSQLPGPNRSLLAACVFFAQLPPALALVSRFRLNRPVAQGLSLAYLRLFFAVLIPEMHKGSAQPEADDAADNQQDDA